MVNDLGLRHFAANLLPKDLNFMQKRDRVDVAKDMLSKVDSDPSFIKRIITGDEFSWITEVLCIMNSFQKARPSTRSIILALWDVFVKQFTKKRPDLWANNSWILHHDNAPSYNAIFIREHLAKNETRTIQQPSNSPDLASCDFFLFGRLKKPLRRTRYNTRDEVMEKSKMALMAIPQTDY